MNFNSNLPVGAMYEKSAPWNEEDRCRKCDADELREEYLCKHYTEEQQANGEYDDKEVEDYVRSFSLCEGCYNLYADF
jgi:ribosomal protein L40E